MPRVVNIEAAARKRLAELDKRQAEIRYEIRRLKKVVRAFKPKTKRSQKQ